MVQNSVVFEGKRKGAITLKPERQHPSKLVCMHFTSTSTCIKFLSQFYFLTSMDYSPWSEEQFRPFLKANKKEPYLRNQKGHACPPYLVGNYYKVDYS